MVSFTDNITINIIHCARRPVTDLVRVVIRDAISEMNAYLLSLSIMGNRYQKHHVTRYFNTG